MQQLWVNLSTSSQAAWGPFYKGKARERGCGSTLRVLSWLGEENILITVHLITQGNKVFPPFFGGGIFELKWMREFHTGKSTKVYEMQLESFHLPWNVSQFRWPTPIFTSQMRDRCLKMFKFKQNRRFYKKSVDFVARGRPLRGQKRLAPLAKRSTCSKSSKTGVFSSISWVVHEI